MSSRPPELDGEQEIDFGRWVAAVATRWWLPLAGLVAGVVLGFLVSASGEQVFRAQALVYLGDPFAPSGARVTTLSTSISSIREIVTSEAAVRRAATESGLAPQAVRGGIFVQQVAGAARTPAPSLVNIGVRGSAPRRVATAANELARSAVAGVSGYSSAKVEGLRGQIASANEELESLERRITAALEAAEAPGLSPSEKLIALTNAGLLEQRRSTVLQSRSDRQQLLALAENVESPRVVERAVARRVTAQSRRNSLVAAAALGLLAGIAAALLWDPVAARVRPGRA